MYKATVGKGAARAGVICLAAVIVLAGTARADEEARPRDRLVITPGQEELLGRIAGVGPEPVGGGCRFVGAVTERDFARLVYRCGGGEVGLELRHVDAPDDALLRTAAFAVTGSGDAIPPGLLEALGERIRANEGEWKWVRSRSAERQFPEPEISPPPQAGDDLFSPEEQVIRRAALDAYAKRRFDESLAKYLELARVHPEDGTLGMVVAALASTRPDAERVEELSAAAARDPDDKLLQFLAGVGAHYAAHQSAQSFADKKELYRVALRYLTPLQEVFGFEPRLFIYLAVSHFRLGHQDEAEAFIEKAATLATDDPDVFYCRAEIFQRKDVKKALADLEFYIDMSKRLQAQGAIVNEKKEEQVQRMYRHLKAVSEGRAEHEELFDPIDRGEGAPVGSAFARLVVVVGSGAFVLALGISLLRRRRSRS